MVSANDSRYRTTTLIEIRHNRDVKRSVKTRRRSMENQMRELARFTVMLRDTEIKQIRHTQ
jgi:hypothetical protein